MTESTKEKFQAALSLLGENGENWVNHPPTKVGEYCTLTACDIVGGSLLYKKLYHYNLIGGIESIGSWNDRHSFQEVKQLFQEAIRISEEKERGN